MWLRAGTAAGLDEMMHLQNGGPALRLSHPTRLKTDGVDNDERGDVSECKFCGDGVGSDVSRAGSSDL